MGNNLLRFALITLSLAIILISGKSEGMESLDSQRKTQNPLLFELTHKLNPECKGYFLGTHHHLTLDVFSQPVQDIIESAKTVFVEQKYEVLTFDLLKELGALTRSPSIKWYDGLTPQEYEQILSVFAAANEVDPMFGDFNRYTLHIFKPWAVYALLSLAQGQTDSKNLAGMDSSFHYNSRQGLLQLFGLETTKGRVLAYGLPNIPDDEAIKDIKELLQGGEDTEGEEKLEAMYLRGDLKEWEDSEWDLVKESKYINIKTAYLRNKGMLKELFAHLLQGTNTLIPLLIAVECPFIIPVGCAHLLGKGGLLMDSSIRNTFNIKRVTNEGQAVDFVYTPER